LGPPTASTRRRLPCETRAHTPRGEVVPMERPSSRDQIGAGAPLLRCLEALEQMMREERLASDAPRAGSEIELALVDDQMRPAMVNQAVLERSASEVLTSELGSWNM